MIRLPPRLNAARQAALRDFAATWRSALPAPALGLATLTHWRFPESETLLRVYRPRS